MQHQQQHRRHHHWRRPHVPSCRVFGHVPQQHFSEYQPQQQEEGKLCIILEYWDSASKYSFHFAQLMYIMLSNVKCLIHMLRTVLNPFRIRFRNQVCQLMAVNFHGFASQYGKYPLNYQLSWASVCIIQIGNHLTVGYRCSEMT